MVTYLYIIIYGIYDIISLIIILKGGEWNLENPYDSLPGITKLLLSMQCMSRL